MREPAGRAGLRWELLIKCRVHCLYRIAPNRAAGNCEAKCGCWGGCGIFMGFLVSSAAERRDPREEAGDRDAARSAVGAGADERRASVCDARFVPASRNSIVARTIRWEDPGVQLSRL